MLIIDKYKDFYDLYSHVYGVDKTIVLDRRGSRILQETQYMSWFETWQGKYEKPYFVLLEAGYVQYVIKVFNLQHGRNSIGQYTVVYFDCEVFHTYKEQRHLFESPISIRLIEMPWRLGKKGREYYADSLDEMRRVCSKWPYEIIDLPILTGSPLTKILDGFELWKELSTYISSLRNEKVVDTLNDGQKAEVHGFDKYSFRHPVK